MWRSLIVGSFEAVFSPRLFKIVLGSTSSGQGPDIFHSFRFGDSYRISEVCELVRNGLDRGAQRWFAFPATKVSRTLVELHQVGSECWLWVLEYAGSCSGALVCGMVQCRWRLWCRGTRGRFWCQGTRGRCRPGFSCSVCYFPHFPAAQHFASKSLQHFIDTVWIW